MRKYAASTWFAGCTSLALVGACSPTGSEGANDAPGAYADGGFDDEKGAFQRARGGRLQPDRKVTSPGNVKVKFVLCDLGCGDGQAVDENATRDDGEPCATDAKKLTVNQAACDAEQALFAACCVPTGGSTGDTTGGSTGDTTGGTTGDGAGGDRPKWCVGADTDEVAPPTYDDGIACTFCPSLNANTATGWEKDGICSKARTNAILADLRNPGGGACAAARAKMASTCCVADYQPPRDPMRALCVDRPGTFPSTDLCQDGCFPSKPNSSLLYASSGAVGYWLNQQGDRTNTCLQNDTAGSDIRWSCKKVYYLLKFGHLPPQLAKEVAYWWNREAGCGCDGQNTNNPDNQN